jgi:hypothetical protein
MPHGRRYGVRCDPVFLAFARQIPLASYRRALRFYELVLEPGACTTDELAYLACNDRFFLLTQILRRPDAMHPWLYDRCREVEANPDGYLDLWARYHYKDVDKTTPVLTTEGWKKHGDLVPGDEVFSPSGVPTRVLATRAFDDAACFRVTFDNGISIDCGAGHLWTVEVPSRARIAGGKRAGRRTVTIETGELARRQASGARPLVRATAALEMPTAVLPVDPYVMGAWLGDGTSADGTITAGDREIFEEIARRGYEVGPYIAPYRRTVYGLRPRLREAGVLGNKHIPMAYMLASAEQRLAVLQGLIDTDGSASPDNGCITFAQTDRALAEQVQTLANSLGFKARITPVRAGEGSWHVVFQASAEQRPCLLARKLAKLPPRDRRVGSRGWRVHSVEPIATVATNCIQVEAADGLYLVGKELIPTHNSTIGTFAGIIQEIARDPNITIAIFSITKDVAAKFGRQIMREIEENPLLCAIFPDIFPANPEDDAPLWSRDQGITIYRTENPKEPTLSWYGLLDALPTGSHFKLRDYDDVITERVTTMTDTDQIKRITTQWELSHNLGTLDSNRMWHWGTRYSYADSYGVMIAEGMLKVRLYPATHNGRIDGRPVLMTQEKWDEQKVLQKSQIAAQMLQNPLATNAATFTVAHLRSFLLRPRILNVYILGDPSKGTGHRSDRTALIVLGFDAQRNVYLLDGMLHRMKQSERWENLRNLYLKWSKQPGVAHVRVGYERYGMQTDLEYFEERMISEEIGMDLVEVSWTRDGTVSKNDRIGRLEPLFRNSRFRFPSKVWRPIIGNCIWKALPNDPDDKDSAWKVIYRPLITAETKEAVSALLADDTIEPAERDERLVKMTLLREEREAIEAGEGYRVVQPIKRMNENREVYDLTTELFLEYSMHPFSPHDDGLDATSRLFDVNPTPPMLPSSSRDLLPLSIE